MEHQQRPNIVLLTTHDLGTHVHCYGANTVRTPRLDQLAEKGVLFNHVFSAAPQCSPARASIATGRYPHSNGVMGLSHAEFAWHLPASERHLASFLKENGYHTILFGLQHVIDRPRLLGFDQVWERHAPAALVASEVNRWLSTAAQRECPFYVEIGFDDTHRPWTTNPPDRVLGTERPRWLPEYPNRDEEISALQGQILAVDRAVGEILDGVESAGLADNTWIIFTSDHGLAMPRAKGTLYDPGIEVPLILRWPRGGIDGGRVIESLVSHIDLVPTILDSINCAIPSSIQGVSFWPQLMGTGSSVRQEIFAEKTYHNTYDPIRCIRTAQYKLIMHFNTYDIVDVPTDVKDSPSYALLRRQFSASHSYCQLFDLNSDPLELKNLVGRQEYQAILADLIHRLRSWMIQTQDPILNGPIVSPHYKKALNILNGNIDLLLQGMCGNDAEEN